MKFIKLRRRDTQHAIPLLLNPEKIESINYSSIMMSSKTRWLVVESEEEIVELIKNAKDLNSII